MCDFAHCAWYVLVQIEPIACRLIPPNLLCRFMMLTWRLWDALTLPALRVSPQHSRLFISEQLYEVNARIMA
jgi:hypothetical protein